MHPFHQSRHKASADSSISYTLWSLCCSEVPRIALFLQFILGVAFVPGSTRQYLSGPYYFSSAKWQSLSVSRLLWDSFYVSKGFQAPAANALWISTELSWHGPYWGLEQAPSSAKTWDVPGPRFTWAYLSHRYSSQVLYQNLGDGFETLLGRNFPQPSSVLKALTHFRLTVGTAAMCVSQMPVTLFSHCLD